MDTLISFGPTSIWIISLALSSAVLITVLMLYLFNSRRIAAITDLEGTVADLMARKKIMESEYQKIQDHIAMQNEELLRIDAERKEQEKLRTELDVLTRKMQEMDAKNQELRDEVGQLNIQKNNIDEQHKRAIEETQSLIHRKDEIERQLQTMDQELSDRQQEIAQKLEEFKENHKKYVDHQIKNLEDKLREKKREFLSYETDFKNFEEKLREQKQELKEVKSHNQNAQEKVIEAEIRFQAISTESGQKEARLTDLNQSIENLQSQKQIIENEVQENSRNSKKEYEQMLLVEEKKQEYERTLNRLEIEKARLKDKIKKLKMEVDQSEKGVSPDGISSAYSDLFVEPSCLVSQRFIENDQDIDEIQALQKFQDSLENEGIIFPKRIIYSFHTSLKCAAINPLTVLAGVSGTGKTLLPIKYARLMGMHSLVMAVQPRWDSPQDMFGFYNYLEKRYKATDLARALVRMDEYNDFSESNDNYKDRMLLVLMDEMNLARTEYYFSEFLSKLELRRDVKDPSDPSDRERAEVVLDLGSNGSNVSRLWVGDNILFVGTMNEDETTQSLSDKVLDRANVLRFGKPTNCLPDNFNPVINNNEPKELTHRHWKAWQHNSNQQSSWSSEVANWTERINSALEKVGRPFGYRVEKAIRLYVDNYPGVNLDRQKYKQAFADQIEQKIMPKLRGLELSDSLTAHCLGDLEMIIAELNDADLIEGFQKAKEPNNTNMFAWHGVSRS